MILDLSLELRVVNHFARRFRRSQLAIRDFMILCLGAEVEGSCIIPLSLVLTARSSI